MVGLKLAAALAEGDSAGVGKAKVGETTGVGEAVATVVKVAQNANELTVSSYSNAADRAKGGQQQLKNLGRPRPNVPPGG